MVPHLETKNQTSTNELKAEILDCMVKVLEDLKEELKMKLLTESIVNYRKGYSIDEMVHEKVLASNINILNSVVNKLKEKLKSI
jgi:RNAse (barnase) inhibitor barstar